MPGTDNIRELLQGLLRKVEAGEDPATVLTQALEVSADPNPTPGPPAFGPADDNDFGGVREHGWGIMERPKKPKREYFMPATDDFGERRR